MVMDTKEFDHFYENLLKEIAKCYGLVTFADSHFDRDLKAIEARWQVTNKIPYAIPDIDHDYIPGIIDYVGQLNIPEPFKPYSFNEPKPEVRSELEDLYWSR